MTCTHAFRPRVESLEERTLLSTCHVTRLSDIGGGGTGSGWRGDLRYCIFKVNNEPGADVIDFIRTGTIFLSGPLPYLNSEVHITGPGVDSLTIDGQLKGRIFNIGSRANVEISGMTLKNGKDVAKENGGGIYNQGALVLRDLVVTANHGFGKAGGIYNAGTLLILDSVIATNLLETAGCCLMYGGGIYNQVNAVLLLQDSELTGNAISGGISHRGIGGGLANFGFAAVVGTTISDNHAISWGGWGGVAGGIFNTGELRVESSLISQNETLGDYYALGGGISNGWDPWDSGPIHPGGNVTIVNSTITENVASARGDDFGEALGGGINTENGGSVTLIHSTVAHNQSVGEQAPTTGRGGGIAITNSALHIQNTILANNVAKTTGQDIYGTIASSGYNIFKISAGGSGYDETDLLNVNPLLGPLADNGGPTQTHALLPGSPAIDAGDPNLVDAPEWDQRGPEFARIVYGIVDIGAFEVQATDAPLPNPFLAVLVTADLGNEPFDWRI